MSEYDDIFDSHEITKISDQFRRLKGSIYLDNAGTSLYAECQMKSIHEDLLKNVHLNPHTSKTSADLMDQVRYDVLHAFNTNSDEYSLIFTSGSTAALKIVAEAFNFKSLPAQGCNKTKKSDCNNGAFGYLTDNHTSVLGMREVAKSKNATVFYLSPNEMYDTMKQNKVTNGKLHNERQALGLFVYPAESNFNGVKYPVKWIEEIHNGKLNKLKVCDEWYLFLDTATFVATNRLDLSLIKPDFLCISFYKIFGYPTGLGALLVKNSSSHVLSEKNYFGGGTVDAVLSGGDYHIKRKNIINRFEDGTLPFLSIAAVKHGFDTLNRLVPRAINNNTMDTISRHTFMLAKHLYEELESLHHANNCKAAKLYIDSDYSSENDQGGIVNFNLLRSNGEYIGYAEVAHMAELFNIHLRVGSFCNSGSCQRHLGLTNDEYIELYHAGHVCGDENDLINGKPTGCVRVSFGYMNSMKDVDILLNMICKCFVDGTPLFKPICKQSKGSICNVSSTYEKPYEGNVEKKIALLENNNQIIITTKPNGFISKTNIILQSICVYPIKSCGAYECYSKWPIGPKGLLYDREWMIVKESGVALTQKEETKMCLIKPIFDFENDRLKLTYSDMEDTYVPLKITIKGSDFTASFCRSKVCGDRITGYDCGDEVGEWLSISLNIFGLRLIRQSNEIRSSKPKKDSNAQILGLANQAQYLLINRASVTWLSKQVESREFDDRIENLVQRFRGNLIIDSEEEFIENSWKEIVIGGKIFKVEGPCTRCQMICIDQETGFKTTEPLRTIAKAFQGKMRFGLYLSYVGTADNSQTLTCSDFISYSNTNVLE